MISDLFLHGKGEASGTLTALVLVVALLLRVTIGYFPYSGENEGPHFGDYEAQRHWMEITLNTKPSEWYTVSGDEGQRWWPLDYPPLTAYHEYLLGLISAVYEPPSIVMDVSRGYETSSHRTFMRLTVVVSDLLVYFPAVLTLVTWSKRGHESLRPIAVAVLLLHPLLIFIDHCHFQYNTVAIGLVIAATSAILNERVYLSASLYTLAFLYKQTMLYFAPAFFFFMLGQALKLPLTAAMKRIALLGIVVLTTTFIVFLPLLADCESYSCVAHRVVFILRRIFPFWRGAFEDYVSNFWVAINPIMRLRNASIEQLEIARSFSTVLTLAASLVPCWAILRNPRIERFPVVLAAVSLDFYLFSWLVHEKAVLLPLTSMLCALTIGHDSALCTIVFPFMDASLLSCFPLMLTEKSVLGVLSLAYLGSTVVRCLPACTRGPSKVNKLHWLSYICNTGGLLGALCLVSANAPIRYPYLWQLVIAVCCCGTFIITWIRLVLHIYR